MCNVSGDTVRWGCWQRWSRSSRDSCSLLTFVHFDPSSLGAGRTRVLRWRGHDSSTRWETFLLVAIEWHPFSWPTSEESVINYFLKEFLENGNNGPESKSSGQENCIQSGLLPSLKSPFSISVNPIIPVCSSLCRPLCRSIDSGMDSVSDSLSSVSHPSADFLSHCVPSMGTLCLTISTISSSNLIVSLSSNSKHFALIRLLVGRNFGIRTEPVLTRRQCRWIWTSRDKCRAIRRKLFTFPFLDASQRKYVTFALDLPFFLKVVPKRQPLVAGDDATRGNLLLLTLKLDDSEDSLFFFY